MTDLEDEDNIGELPDSQAMEILCRNYGTNLYRRMVLSEVESPREFFISALQETVHGHPQWNTARKSVIDFAVDSYIFYRRHKEESISEAKRDALVDTYGDMMAIANEQPLRQRRMMDDWW